MIIIKLNYYH